MRSRTRSERQEASHPWWILELERAQRACCLPQRERAWQQQRQSRLSLVSSSKAAGGALDPIAFLSACTCGWRRIDRGCRFGSRETEASANLSRQPLFGVP